jgi:hypothetical protein
MNVNTAGRRGISIASAGHAVFAALLIAFGVLGLIQGNFNVFWQPVPKDVPAREALAYFSSSVSLACGIGLLWRRTAALAAGVLLALLVLWFLVWRVPAPLSAPRFIEGTWSCGENDGDDGGRLGAVRRVRLGPRAGSPRLRDRRAGRAHREGSLRSRPDPLRLRRTSPNVPGTAPLVPGWLPWHVFWAYFTGAYLHRGGAGRFSSARTRDSAAALSALQMGLFGLLVWVPIVASGSANAFQWLEFETTLALTAAGWVVADSTAGYPGSPWASGRRRPSDAAHAVGPTPLPRRCRHLLPSRRDPRRPHDPGHCANRDRSHRRMTGPARPWSRPVFDWRPVTTIWRAWVGFNFSHSLGLLVFGGIFGGLALYDFRLVAGSVILQVAAVVVAGTYALLAARFWFPVPAVATALGAITFLASAIVNALSR